MSRTIRILLALIAIFAIAGPATAAARHGKKHKAKAVKKDDRNRDGISDRWERRHRLSLRVNQASRDQDRDGVRNRGEFLAGTDPRDRDSDDDGIRDGAEGAGKVVSFAGGVLTIEAFAGGSVTGKVDASTEIECESDDDEGEHHHRGGANSSSRGSDHGDREDDGDDDGPNHDAGDDHGRDDDDDGRPANAPASGTTTPATGTPSQPATPAPAKCTVADLKPGAVVHEAELKVGSGGNVWHEIELVRTPAAPATS